MFTKLILTWFIAAISFFIFYTCSDSTSPTTVSNNAYMVLNVGDERQVIYTQDSSTILMKIIGTTKRSDGLDVFIGKQISGTSDTSLFESYYALTDSFYIATELKIGSSINENPFREQRLAKLYPLDGDTWLHTQGDYSTPIMRAKFIGTKTVPAGIFNDVYGFHLDNLMTLYYARGVGYIGTKVEQDSNYFVTTYMKIGGRVYGKLFPPKDFTDINDGPGLAASKHFIGYGFFGEKITR